MHTLRQMTEREQRTWDKVGDPVGARQPDALVTVLTPWPAWVLLICLFIFAPGVVLLSFFVRRRAVVRFGNEIVVYEISFFRMANRGVLLRAPRGELMRRRSVIEIGDERMHVEPGWGPVLDRLIGAL